jgi:lipopolysaccharide heptosyltransferase II
MKKLDIKGNEKFLVVRTDRIGDVLLSTPVLEAIKRKYPKSKVSMMISPYTKDLLINNPWVDEIITYEQSSSSDFFKLVKSLRKKKFDFAILLRPTLRMALLLYLSGIRVRIGTGYRAYQFLFNCKVYEHRKTIEKHELEYNLSMLVPLGISGEVIVPRIFLSAEEETISNKIFDEQKVKKDDLKIIVHPGSGNSSLNYPLGKFAVLADKLIEEFSAKVILTGNSKEVKLSEAIRRKMRNKPVDLTGKTNLRELSSVLKGSDLLISNSTGPIHMAVALGTPVVALFSPLFVASPKRWGPYGEGNEVVMPPVEICHKCEKEKCSHFNCMDKIDPDEVVSRVRKILDRKSKKVNR